MSFDLTTPVAVPQLDAQGNYIGDLKDGNGQTVTAPFVDFVRFGDIEAQRSNQLTVALTAVVTNLAAAQGQQFTGDQVKGWIEDAVAAHPTTINITGVAGTTATP
jgi:hypothetical protein